jgi:hypothetical protein
MLPWLNHNSARARAMTTKFARPTTSTTTQDTPSVPKWAYATVVVLLIVGLALGYIVKRPSVSKPQD